jgi:hypothetical protein
MRKDCMNTVRACAMQGQSSGDAMTERVAHLFFLIVLFGVPSPPNHDSPPNPVFRLCVLCCILTDTTALRLIPDVA